MKFFKNKFINLETDCVINFDSLINDNMWQQQGTPGDVNRKSFADGTSCFRDVWLGLNRDTACDLNGNDSPHVQHSDPNPNPEGRLPTFPQEPSGRRPCRFPLWHIIFIGKWQQVHRWEKGRPTRWYTRCLWLNLIGCLTPLLIEGLLGATQKWKKWI